MIYDTAWDMPKSNWMQQGSFTIPEIPPVYEPDSEPLICLPPINRYWHPLVMGALDQLRNPSSWLVADDSAMYNTLARVTKLREMIGAGGDCMTLSIRYDVGTCQLQQSTDGGITWTEVEGWADFASCLPPQTQIQFTDGCLLEQSLDGGVTWTTVTGWAEYWSTCVQDAAPIIGLPPNPGDQSPDQLACSISTYLAEQIIVGAMGLAVTAVQDDLTLLTFGANVLNLIPEFVLVRLGYDAIATLYGYVAEGTLTDYEGALTDATLLSDVICAIYGCILTDGYVTPTNFACIVAAIGSIPYTHADVITAIVGYLDSLGATGIAQVSQIAGLETGADCSACGDWCNYWGSDSPDGLCDGTWVRIPSDGCCGLCSSNVWHANDCDGFWCLIVECTLPSPRTIGNITVTNNATGEYAHIFLYDHDGGTLIDDLPGSGATGTWHGVGFIQINYQQATTPMQITAIQLAGGGTSPFGASTC